MKQGYYIGIDVGGTKVLGCLIQFRGDTFAIVHQDLFFVHGLSKKEFITSLHNLTKELVSFAPKNRVQGIGVGLPGQTDQKRKKFLNAPNLSYLKDIVWDVVLGKRFRTPVKIGNDAHCFTLAEALFGKGKKYNAVFGMTLGTGVGGGLVVGKEIFYGAQGTAAEVGHMVIDGGKTLEMLGSSKFLKEQTAKSPKEMENAARRGDKKARALYRALGLSVGIGAANIVNAVNPDIIVFGGNISNAFDLIQAEIKKQIKKYAVSPLAKKTPCVQSMLGGEAGAIGAAALFL